MRLECRPAQVGDGAGIARVHVETWQAAYAGLLPDEYLKSLTSQLERRTAWWERQIVDAPSRSQTVTVAEDDKGIVGFVTCGPAEGDDASLSVGQVYAIYVHPRAWSQGVGRVLFARAVEALRSARFGSAVLWVLDTNARARRFYEIAGWHPDGGTKTEMRGDIALNEVRYRTAF